MLAVIENEEEFINFIKNTKLYEMQQMYITFNHKLDIKKNKNHEIHYNNLQTQFKHIPLITDLQKIILDYYTLDHTIKCDCHKRRQLICTTLYYPEDFVRINVDSNSFYTTNYSKLEKYSDEIMAVFNYLRSMLQFLRKTITT